MKYFSRLWARWKAYRLHKRLVREAKADWVIRETARITCKHDGNPCGTMVIVGEQNGLGDRRVRVISKPSPLFDEKRTNDYAELLLWAAQTEKRSIPIKEFS